MMAPSTRKPPARRATTPLLPLLLLLTALTLAAARLQQEQQPEAPPPPAAADAAATPQQAPGASAGGTSIASGATAGWPSWGADARNARYANQTHTSLSDANAGRLAVAWSLNTSGDVASTPAVSRGVVYAVDLGGSMWAVNASSGAVIWQRRVVGMLPAANATSQGAGGGRGAPPIISRTTPALGDTPRGEVAVIGTQAGLTPNTAFVIGVNASTGAPLWVARPNAHPFARVTQSATVVDGAAYVGVASGEEFVASPVINLLYGGPANATCCSFSGSMHKLDLATGQVLWSFFTQPPPPAGTNASQWYAGGGVWGSAPLVDTARRLVTVGIGNSYQQPPATLAACSGLTQFADQLACYTSQPGGNDSWVNAIIALDTQTGQLRWGQRFASIATWTLACGTSVAPRSVAPVLPSYCPGLTAGTLTDWDFGQAPIHVTLCPEATPTTTRGSSAARVARDAVPPGPPGPCHDLYVAGQKSGFVFALNPDDGSLVWANKLGPGGDNGGFEWGSAADGVYWYGANANSASDLVNLTEVASSQPRTGNASTASSLNITLAPPSPPSAASSSSSSPSAQAPQEVAPSSGPGASSATHTAGNGSQPVSGTGFACSPPGLTPAPNGGFIVAVDLRSGAVAWVFGNPLLGTNSTPGCPVGAKFLGPVTVAGPPGPAGAVVLAPSMDANGTLFLLSGANGSALGTFQAGASLLAGPSVVGDLVFVGSGYNSSPIGTPGTKLWALRVPAA